MTRLILTLSVLLGLVLTAPRPAHAQTTLGPPDLSLADVSCVSASWCMAVGSQSTIQYGVGPVNTVGLAERWDGSTWTEVPLPQAATAVSCASPSACTAVGGMAAERWDGTGWTAESVPLPPVSDSPSLSSVSCASVTFCLAVGAYYPSTNGAPPWHTLIEVWNGTGWSTQTPLAPPGPAKLTDVSCSSPTACTAIGSAPTNTELVSVIYRWDGSAWTLQPVPGLAAYPGIVFTSVSCSSDTTCTAIGSDQAAQSRANPVAAQWNGSDWSLVQMPLPAGIYSAQLTAISCSAAASCVAVGSSIPWSGPALGLVERWNGSTWAIQPAAVPAGNFSELSGVACLSEGPCVAVGWYWFNTWGQQALIEGWNGTSWAIQPGPGARTMSSLDAISCSSPARCIAVGSQQTASGISATLAEEWNGHGWTTRPTPNPAGALSDSLEAASCSSSRACTAVGSTLAYDGSWRPLAERWDGSTWAIEATPDPGSDAISSLSGVACPSTTLCLAVGSRQSGATSVPLVERRDGTSWALQSFSVPSDVISAMLSAISCSSASACTAVGSATHESGVTVALVARWNGSIWTIQQTATDFSPIRPPVGFSSISCPGATACFALGGGTKANLTGVPVVERWNGTRWSTQAFPTLENISAGTPESIACSSPSACTAVSFASSTGAGFVSVVDRWNGKKWRMQSQASPPGSSQTQLIGTSCPARSVCLATGNYIDASGNQRPLAERWNGRAWSIQSAE